MIIVKILVFQYIHSHQHIFGLFDITFIVCDGNEFLHNLVEPIICTSFLLDSPNKLNIVKLLFFFSEKIFSLKPVFGVCLYAVSNPGSLHTYKETLKSYN